MVVPGLRPGIGFLSSSASLLVVEASQLNLNLLDAYESEFGTAYPGAEFFCKILADVTIGSASVSLPALDAGDWPELCRIQLDVFGRIQGRGGTGGNGNKAPKDGSLAPPATAGQQGGPALYTRVPIIINVASGQLRGGGGGGGGSGGASTGDGFGGKFGGTGAGGGAGTNPGPGGTGALGQPVGQPGTSEAGGAAGPGNPGVDIIASGDGGDPGEAGENGTHGGQPGGPPGAAIDGVSYVSGLVGGEDILGPQIN